MRRPEQHSTLRHTTDAVSGGHDKSVLLAVASQDEGVGNVIEQMKTSTVERDNERAAIYVATVRPAMATTRYRRIRLDETLENPVTSLVENENSDTGVETGEGGHSIGGGVRVVASDDVEAGEGAVAGVLDGEERAVLRQKVTHERRQRRREARRAARQRRRDRVASHSHVKCRQREKVDKKAVERREEAVSAMQALVERRKQRAVAPSVAEECEQKESMPVKLVKHLRDRAEATPLAAKDAEEYVSSADGLPTAKVRVNRVWREIKLDSCARYTVAGTAWMQYGDRLKTEAPVNYVEGIGGFLLDVIGVWRFQFRTVFGELVCVEACIVDGCDDEFLLGVDFLKEHGAKLDFERNELVYRAKERRVVIPFRTDEVDGGDNRARIAAVRMVRRTQLTGNAVTPVEVSVAAPDGELGMFVPTRCTGAVMLASTVTRARDGKAIVPMINAAPGRTRLPSKKELGVWIPIADDMEVLEINGELNRDRVKTWLDEISTQKLLNNENDVKIGVEDEDSRKLILKLLRAYRNLIETTGDCPPPTALPVEHHIDTGDAAPIMLKRRRQAQTDDAIVEENVQKMLAAGVIEEGNGAWGFPVVLVRKKDGEVRFCVDYRALNKIDRKSVV